MKGFARKGYTTWHDPDDACACPNPNCRVRLTGSSSPDNHNKPPTSGDRNVCVYCNTVSVFTGKGLGLRACTPDELEESLANEEIQKAILFSKTFQMTYPDVVRERQYEFRRPEEAPHDQHPRPGT